MVKTFSPQRMRLDHVVLWVEDPARSLEFFEKVVGLEGVRAEEFRKKETMLVKARLEASGTKTGHFMEQQFGARGLAPKAYYFRDPDGNVLEARHY